MPETAPPITDTPFARHVIGGLLTKHLPLTAAELADMALRSRTPATAHAEVAALVAAGIARRFGEACIEAGPNLDALPMKLRVAAMTEFAAWRLSLPFTAEARHA